MFDQEDKHEYQNRNTPLAINDFVEKEALALLTKPDNFYEIRQNKYRADKQREKEKFKNLKFHSIQQKVDLNLKGMAERGLLVPLASKEYRMFIEKITDPSSVFQSGQMLICYTCWQWVNLMQSKEHRNLGHQVSLSMALIEQENEEAIRQFDLSGIEGEDPTPLVVNPIRTEGDFYNLCLVFNMLIREHEMVYLIQEYQDPKHQAYKPYQRPEVYLDEEPGFFENPLNRQNTMCAHLKISKDNSGNIKGCPPCLSIPQVPVVQGSSNGSNVQSFGIPKSGAKYKKEMQSEAKRESIRIFDLIQEQRQKRSGRPLQAIENGELKAIEADTPSRPKKDPVREEETIRAAFAKFQERKKVCRILGNLQSDVGFIQKKIDSMMSRMMKHIARVEEKMNITSSSSEASSAAPSSPGALTTTEPLAPDEKPTSTELPSITEHPTPAASATQTASPAPIALPSKLNPSQDQEEPLPLAPIPPPKAATIDAEERQTENPEEKLDL